MATNDVPGLSKLVNTHLAAAPVAQTAGWAKAQLVKDARAANRTLYANPAIRAFLLGSSGGGGAYDGVVVADGPAGYWRFENVQGLSATDRIAFNDGQYVLVTAENVTAPLDVQQFAPRTPGAVANSLALTFVQDAVGSTGRRVWINGTPYSWAGAAPGFSLECWAQPRVALPSSQYALDLGNEATGTVVTIHAQLQFRVDGSVRWLRQNPLGTITVQGGVITPGAWAHLVCVRIPGSPAECLLYVNGAEVARAPDHIGASYPTPAFLAVGGKGKRATATENFDGMVDEVAIYSRPLTPAEVLEHYNARLA